MNTRKTTPQKSGEQTLLDHVMDKLDLKNDAALARELNVGASAICKVRKGRTGMGATMKLRILEAMKGKLSLDQMTAMLKPAT